MGRVRLRRSYIQARPALLLQKIHRYSLKGRVRPIQGIHCHLFVAPLPLPIIEAHGAGKAPEELGVGY